MGSLFRSEEMTLSQLFLQSEAAYACVSELGELGLVQFRDLNADVNSFQRKFVNEVRRCDEMERKLRFLDKEIKKDSIPILDTGDNPEAPQPREMIDLEATFEKLENELREVNTNNEALKKTFLELTELKHILRKTQAFFDEQENTTLETESLQKSLVANDFQSASAQLSFVSGVILRERLPSFERMLWRVCRGNAFLKQADIDVTLEDPISGDQVVKSVFIIFFQGEQLKSRVKKICEGFRATLYPCPEIPADRREMANGVMTRIEDLSIVLRQTQDHRHRVLVAAAKNIKNWFVKVRKIKAIYHTLNLFNLDVTQKCLIAECWCALSDLGKIQLALRRATEMSGSSMPSILNRMETKETPPTYNRTNKFTSGFQEIVNVYGISNYREINPAPYTIITFPFLFAVMFGDFGHGLLMTMFALWMVVREKKIIAEKSDSEMWNGIFGGRYIILLMGLFSIYTGLIYNDVFSKSFNIFGSSWEARTEGITPTDYFADQEQLNPANSYYGTPYPVGIDPVWQFSGNKILFLNSYKMKTAIIFGITQMVFGVILSLFNHTYFRRTLNVLCDFIPQMIFLLSIFGYLAILIFYKWVHSAVENAACSPSILIHLINMFLFSYSTDPCYLGPIYHGQQTVQTILVVVAVLCIPWMLLVKPFYLRHAWRKNLRLNASLNNSLEGLEGGQQNREEPGANSGHGGGHGDHGTGDKFDFGSLFIDQAIHTIEYCLGSISHTASYLRLWALSLAHAQLSEVLWNMVLRNGLSAQGWSGGILLYVYFGAWAVGTVVVLLIMEGLSAFLHALRLHWVEFQSKFYQGTGYIFSPFAFETILQNASIEE